MLRVMKGIEAWFRARGPGRPSADHGVRSIAVLGDGATGVFVAEAAHSCGFPTSYQDSPEGLTTAGRTDLVVECFVGQLALTHTVLGLAEALAARDAILATTSRLPLAALAESATSDPRRLVSLRLPRHRMPDVVEPWHPRRSGELVEVVVSRHTSPLILGRVMAFLRAVGAVPLVVGDSLERFAAQLRSAYATEEVLLLAEDVPPKQITQAARLGGTDASSPEAEIRDRLLFAQALSVLRLLDEEDIDARDADPASVLEAGFPAATGGVLTFVEEFGIDAFKRRADALAARHGERFRVPASLSVRASQRAAGDAVADTG